MRPMKALYLSVVAVALAILAGSALAQCPNGRCGIAAAPQYRPVVPTCPNGRCGVVPTVPAYPAPARRLVPVRVWDGVRWVIQYQYR